ncbi:MAG: SRPBCC family protein [Propionibacteriaceae bacterium]|nr:SRPBCC family protein [Propionibacteriaceae bacterium]
MTDTTITVSRTINAAADAIFDVLTLPQRHRDFDGSGMIVSDDRTNRLASVGDTFDMNMHHESQGGDYQMRNHVTAFVPNKVVGWAPAAPGEEPFGWTWTYTLEPQGPESTEVTLTYDWSEVTDKELLGSLPAVPKPALEESLNLLAATVA